METALKCPKCSAVIAEGEKFCASCGYTLQPSGVDQQKAGRSVGLKFAKQSFQGNIRSGRRTILTISILTVIGGILIAVLQNVQLGEARESVRTAKGNPEYNQDEVAKVESQIAAAEGGIKVTAAVNLGMAVFFFGLWMWAKKKPLPATLMALIVFVAVQVIGMALDPMSAARGWLVKIIILIYLGKAVSSAYKYQRLQEKGV